MANENTTETEAMDQVEGAKTVAVIDGNSLMHRAYHAVPPTMNAPDGTPTNAVFGFLSMFLKFYEQYRPDAIICAFDAGKPSHRIAAMEQYKAQRPPMDQELRVQFPLMEELLASLNVPVVKVQGWEGDDILGTIAARDEALGYRTLLVTGDKDANQLASDLTHILTTKKGITDVVEFDPEKVVEKYGVGPEQFVDFLGLMGDTSDNIPGVPGIGPKTAAKLLQRFQTMEGIYQNLDQLKGKQLENLVNNRDAAFLSRDVAVIRRDLDFECDLEAAAFPAYQPEAVQEAFGKLQLSMHLGKFLGLLGEDAAALPAVELAWEPVLEGEQGAELVARACAEGGVVGVAVLEPEQASLFGPAVSLAFATADGTALLEGDAGLAALADLLRAGAERGQDAPVVAAPDAKELIHQVYPMDTGAPALLTEPQLQAARIFDLGLADYVLNSSKASSLDELSQAHLGASLPQAKQDQDAACIQAAAAAALVEPLTQALRKDQSWDVYEQIDLPLVTVLALMERTGAAIDVAQLRELGESTGQRISELRGKIIELAGEEFNVDSPKQLGRILFEVLGLPPKKKTRTGYSTDAGVLTELAKEHELPGLVLKYRELAKIKSTYIDALPRLCAEGDGRVHSTFHETVTATGRLSSSDPNLQNIPVRTDFGRQIRRCFVPLKPDHVYVSADYSQIELRLLAHLSGDQGLIDAFNSGQDFHAQTAARVFGVEPDQVTPEMRSRAKAVNFGIVYGQQAFGLAQSLDISFGEAKDMIDRYYAAYPGVRSYLDSVVEDAKLAGYAETLYGRKRHIPELRSKNPNQRGFGERTAMNHPMQGTAADIIKLAMVRVRDRMLEEGLDAQLLLQVHDELDFSCAADQVQQLSDLVKGIMEGVVELQVPLVVDVQSGPTWAEAH
ncbi:MAG: DNA polymerase I [Coriobacteriia bacterium]|nr:DNA polymerase I [Coriobacteriia bacterium]